MSESPINIASLFLVAVIIIGIVYAMFQPFTSSKAEEKAKLFSEYALQCESLLAQPAIRGTTSELVLSGDCSSGRGMCDCFAKLSDELGKISNPSSSDSIALFAVAKKIEDCKPYADAMAESCLINVDSDACADDRQEYYVLCGVF